VLVAQGAWSAALQAAFAPFSLTGLVSSPPMAFQPMLLSRRPLPFDHPEWIFELKYDGFRSLAVIQTAFDLLMSDGKDLRSQPLIDRKRELRRVLGGLTASRVRYADHVEREGIALFKRVCEMDLEGIVAKHSFGPYTSETRWFKIKESQPLSDAGSRRVVRARTT